DQRLTPHGRRIGLIGDAAWADFQAKQERLTRMRELLEKTRVEKQHLALSDQHSADFSSAIGGTLAQLLKRPEVRIENLAPLLRELMPAFFEPNQSSSAPLGELLLTSAVRNELKSVETAIKYAGYLQQQERAIERLKKAEQRSIPEWFDYAAVSGLSREMNEKLERVRPRTLAQASRIPGVTPAAVSLINVFI